MSVEQMDAETTQLPRLSSGIDGLDRVLSGGLVRGRSYMVRGKPGVGKTLLGLHFLTAAEQGEAVFVNMGEPEADIRANAETFGLDLSSVSFLDLTPSAEFFSENRSYDIFPPEDVEQVPVTEQITETIESTSPDRVFVDPLTQFRYLSTDDYQFRKQVLSFLQLLKEADCTVLFTSQDTPTTPDDDLQFMSDGIIHLGQQGRRRTIEVTKFRGSDFRSGGHALDIDDSGMTIYPTLVPGDHGQQFSSEVVSSGVEEVDALLDGGLERGTVTFLSGPSGVGKTTTGTQFMVEAARRGERSVVYLFEEGFETFRYRSESIGMPVTAMIESGALNVVEVEALETSPEAFAESVRREVEAHDTSVVMLDGTAGYKIAARADELSAFDNLHALGRYLKNMGVTGIFISETSAITGQFTATEEHVSYLADNILFLRYIEYQGEMRKALGVLKKRASDFERTLREFEITEEGIRVGKPLSQLRGILTGTPEWTAEGPTDG